MLLLLRWRLPLHGSTLLLLGAPLASAPASATAWLRCRRWYVVEAVLPLVGSLILLLLCHGVWTFARGVVLLLRKAQCLPQ